MKELFAIFLIILQISSIYPLTSYLLNEDIENCKTNGSSNYLDFSTVKFTMVNDSLTVVDGKLIVAKHISSPWKSYFFGERYDRGQWSKMLEKNMQDFCNHILNPIEP